jgi:hypothetical protein
VTGSKVFDDTLGAQHVDESTLEAVPQAVDAVDADNANLLDGLDSAAFVQAQGATFTSAGLPDYDGSCADGEKWVDENPSQRNEAGYYRDPFGFVHLRGYVRNCEQVEADSRIFLLPQGYRPSRTEVQPVASETGTGAPETKIVTVNSAGFPSVFTTSFPSGVKLSLDGIAFRCGPSGANGCP